MLRLSEIIFKQDLKRINKLVQSRFQYQSSGTENMQIIELQLCLKLLFLNHNGLRELFNSFA